MRRLVRAALSCGVLLAACRGGSVPNQVLTRPVATSAPTPVARTNGPWSYRRSTQRQGFVVDQRALIAIHRDTSTEIDTISSHAEVAFNDAPAASSVSGSVTAFLVEGAARAAATPPGLAVPFPLYAQYAAHGLQLDFTFPRDAAPCASVSLAVAQSLRDLWFRPPDTLRVGTTWQDSSSYVVCRDGIPLHATVRRAFSVLGTAGAGSRFLLNISRVLHATLEGSGTQFGEAVDVSGAGSGQLVYNVDVTSGEVVSASGNATLELSLRSRQRSQTVRQIVEIRIGRS